VLTAEVMPDVWLLVLALTEAVPAVIADASEVEAVRIELFVLVLTSRDGGDSRGDRGGGRCHVGLQCQRT